MGEEANEFEVYIKPFKVGSREGSSDFHSFNKIGYHSDIAFINTKTAAKKYKLVFLISASNITTNPRDFDFNKLEWYEIKGRFNDLPKPKIIGRLYLPLGKQSFSRLEEMLKNQFIESVGNGADIRFVSKES